MSGYQEDCPGCSGMCFYLHISPFTEIITTHTGVPEPTLPSTRIVKGFLTLLLSWSCMNPLLSMVVLLTVSILVLFTIWFPVSCNARADKIQAKKPCPAILQVWGWLSLPTYQDSLYSLSSMASQHIVRNPTNDRDIDNGLLYRGIYQGQEHGLGLVSIMTITKFHWPCFLSPQDFNEWCGAVGG